MRVELDRSKTWTKCILCDRVIASTDLGTGAIYRYRCDACGEVHITGDRTIVRKYQSDLYLISGYTRERTEHNKPPVELDSSNTIKRLLDSLRIPRSPSEKMDRMLLYLKKHSDYSGDTVPIDSGKDYPIIYAKNAQEFNFILQALQESGYVNTGKGYLRLTIKGFNRIAETHKTRPKSNQCFVAMWFDESLDDVFEKGIERAIQDAGFTPIRVDNIEHNEKICDRIIAEIRKSEFLVADFTRHRAGVYFEAGFAMGLGLPVIWLCRDTDIDSTHFDTRQYNHIVWSSPDDLYKNLLNRIKKTIQ